MTHAISGNSTACASCVCRPIPVLWVGAGGQRGVNAHVLCVFVIFSAHQKQKLNRNVSTPIALLRLSCLNLFGTISLLPFRWKGKPVGVGRCAGWLFLWLYLSLFPSTERVLLHVPEPVLSQICKLLSEPDYITTQTNSLCLQVLSLRTYFNIKSSLIPQYYGTRSIEVYNEKKKSVHMLYKLVFKSL